MLLEMILLVMSCVSCRESITGILCHSAKNLCIDCTVSSPALNCPIEHNISLPSVRKLPVGWVFHVMVLLFNLCLPTPLKHAPLDEFSPVPSLGPSPPTVMTNCLSYVLAKSQIFQV